MLDNRKQKCYTKARKRKERETKEMTNYLAINKNNELKRIHNTTDLDFDRDLAKTRKDAARYGWTIVKGEENEGYLPLIARLGIR